MHKEPVTKGDFAKLMTTLDKRFASIDARFDGMDKKFDEIDERFDSADKKFDSIGGQFSEINAKIVSLSEIVEETNRSLDSLAVMTVSRLDRHENILHAMDMRMSNTEADVRDINNSLKSVVSLTAPTMLRSANWACVSVV